MSERTNYKQKYHEANAELQAEKTERRIMEDRITHLRRIIELKDQIISLLESPANRMNSIDINPVTMSSGQESFSDETKKLPDIDLSSYPEDVDSKGNKLPF